MRKTQKGYSLFWTAIFIAFLGLTATIALSITQIYIQEKVVKESIVIGIRESVNAKQQYNESEVEKRIQKQLRNNAISLKTDKILKFIEKDYGYDVKLSYEERAPWIKNLEIVMPVEEMFSTR